MLRELPDLTFVDTGVDGAKALAVATKAANRAVAFMMWIF